MFKRTIEDFTCEHCATRVQGDGYTNHCPKCLWSKHVDIEPGDRAQSCGGMMEPILLEGSTSAYRVVHRCVKCRTERKNNVRKEDDPVSILKLAGTSRNI